jgi:cobalt-zinc-cadmium resistance protein CzcA
MRAIHHWMIMGMRIMLFCLACHSPLAAQMTISLDEAILVANQHNRQIRSAWLGKEYAKLLTKTATDLPATTIGAENGQFNSAYFDTKFSIAQSFQMPAVFKRKKRWLETSVQTAGAGVTLIEKEIRQQLEDVFNEYGYALAQEKIWQSYLVLVDQLALKADQRVMEGEADVIEKTMAIQQQTQLQWQIDQVQNTLQLLRIELSWLLNDGNSYSPAVGSWDKQTNPAVLDSSRMAGHPQLQMAYHQWQQAVSFTALQRSMLLPSFTVGFNNASIRGTGADNIVYNASKRFSSFQFGIEIPLFRKAMKAEIDAARTDEAMRQLNWEAQTAELWKQWLTLSEKQQLMATRIRHMDNFSMPNAARIKETAARQLSAGVINYLEFVTLMNHAMAIEQEYISLRKEANTIRIAIHYLL